MSDNIYNGKWLHDKLVKCPAIYRVSVRVYSDWIRTDSTLVGFVAHVANGMNKEGRLSRVQEFIDAHGLPLKVEDEAGHSTRFLLKIIRLP